MDADGRNDSPRLSLDAAPLDRSVRRGNPLIIRIFKISLLVVMVGLAVVTFTWTFFTGDDYVENIPAEVTEIIEKNELLEARFDSVDSKGQPFTVIADKAIREGEELVILDRPSGDIQLHSGRFLSVKSLYGRYFEHEKRLILTQQVKLFDNHGYTLETEEMTVDMMQDTVVSPLPVSGQGPAGLIEGVSLFADVNQDFLRFDGPAKLTLFMQDDATGLGALR